MSAKQVFYLCIEKVSGIVLSPCNIRLCVFVTGEYLSLLHLINNPGTISHIKCVTNLGDYELIWFKRPEAIYNRSMCNTGGTRLRKDALFAERCEKRYLNAKESFMIHMKLYTNKFFQRDDSSSMSKYNYKNF